ncbi:MAG: LamG-like jellyroll fold domain-containing protein [Planctomycetota bacterium]
MLSATAAAQPVTDLIYYPFLRGTGTTVQNLFLATGNPVPRTGTFVTTNTGGPWEKNGRIATCMRGKDTTAAGTYNYIDTGWKGGMTGSMTISWFMRLRTDLGFLSNKLPNIGYFISGIGSFRIFTGGVANKGLVLRAWGGQPADIYLGGGYVIPHTGYDLHAAARKNWVHITLVVDAAAGEATYYVNGGPMQTTKITGSINLPTSTGNNFRVGAHTSTGSAFNYDVDEFRLLNRAATQTEIQGWALATLRVDKTNLSMSKTDSQNFTLAAGSAHVGKLYWIFGSLTGTFPGVQLGPVTVPLQPDLYTNLTLGLANTAPLTRFRGVLAQNGAATAALNMPKGYNDPNAIGLSIYHAYVVYDTANNLYLASNPTLARVVK